MENHLKKQDKAQSGITTPLILITASVLIIFAVSLLNWSLTERKSTMRKVKSLQALQVAEAGINYYRWHLAHNDSDYKDGNDWCCDNDPTRTLTDCGNVCGPYVHSYYDYDNNLIGEFSLEITPPEVGSTVYTIKSTGSVLGNENIERKIITRVGKRSLAEDSFLTNAPIWIGQNESTAGPFHSNGGIRFDGTCTAEVTSAVEQYDCAGTGHDCTGTKPGIWGSGGPTTFWHFPVPAIDFSLFTVSLADIKAGAINDGIYYGDSGAEGYLVRFNADATVDIYRVDSLQSRVWYWDPEVGNWRREAEEIQNKTLLGNFSMPNNGLIFIEDDVWVEGTVNGKVTLAAGRFPENPNHYARIRINNNVQYVARDGNHNLGLIAQGDVLVPAYAPNDLTIDATLLSQNGHVYTREYLNDAWCCFNGTYCNVRNNIEVYGGIITNLFWTWTWVNSNGVVCGGYRNTNTVYNNNLTFSPPPSFPTSENFEVLSWKEE